MESTADNAAARPAVLRSALWIRTLAALPWPLLYALAAGTALLLRWVLHYRVAVARDNLRRCFPDRPAAEIERLLGAHYRQLAQVAMEFLKLARLSADELHARVRVIGAERVHAETAARRSVLLLAAHQCNWEWALQATTLAVGVPVDAAYKPLHSAAADRQLQRLRTCFGARLIAAKRLLREVVRRRHEVRAVALLADQVPMSGGGRVWLDFLGRQTAFYPGPGELARSLKLAAFFVSMRRVRRGQYEIEFVPISRADEQLEAAVFTARYARLVEQQVQARPADWTWTHRRWKLAPPSIC